MNKQEMIEFDISGSAQRVFLASPYTHKDEEVIFLRYRETLEATAKLIKEGNMVFSPIVHSHPIAVRYDLPRDYSFWQAYTNSFILHWAEAFSILCLHGWENSVGIKDESILATEVGLSISFMYLD